MSVQWYQYPNHPSSSPSRRAIYLQSMLPPEAGELVWADEFDGTAVDKTKWCHENADPQNQELQDYVTDSRTAAVHDGALRISAFRDPQDGVIYSARLSTMAKFNFTYGVVSARIRCAPGTRNPNHSLPCL